MSGGGIELFIGKYNNTCEEGFWAFFITYDNIISYQCSFCFTLENNILISCLQGSRNKDALQINKIITKASYGLRPTSLLIECIKILTNILNLNLAIGVHEKNQIRSNKSKGYHVDYKKIWLENGGELIKIKNHKYYLLKNNKKDIEEIPSNKRSMYKKRFSMLKNIENNLKEILNNTF